MTTVRLSSRMRYQLGRCRRVCALGIIAFPAVFPLRVAFSHLAPDGRMTVAGRGGPRARARHVSFAHVGKFPTGQDLGELFDVAVPPPALGVLDPASVRLTGLSKPRGEVHRDGDWHRSIHLWVVDAGPYGGGQGAETAGDGPRLLLQQRADTKDTNPGLWDVSVAGHIDAGDDVLETVVREAEEELGLAVPTGSGDLAFTVATEARGTTARHGDFVCREIQYVFLLEAPLRRRQGSGAFDGLRYSTGEVAGLRTEPARTLLANLRARSPEYVPRDVNYIGALEAALARRYPESGFLSPGSG